MKVKSKYRYDPDRLKASVADKLALAEKAKLTAAAVDANLVSRTTQAGAGLAALIARKGLK